LPSVRSQAWLGESTGGEVSLSKDGRLAYVPIYSNVAVGEPGTDGNTIDIVDRQARKLAGSLHLGARRLEKLRPEEPFQDKVKLLEVRAS
jgi:hypothetical protein